MPAEIGRRSSSPMVAPHVVPTSKRTLVVNDAPESRHDLLRPRRQGSASRRGASAVIYSRTCNPSTHICQRDHRAVGRLGTDILSPRPTASRPIPNLWPATRRALAGLPDERLARALRRPQFRHQVVQVNDPDALLNIDHEEARCAARKRAAGRQRVTHRIPKFQDRRSTYAHRSAGSRSPQGHQAPRTCSGSSIWGSSTGRRRGRGTGSRHGRGALRRRGAPSARCSSRTSRPRWRGWGRHVGPGRHHVQPAVGSREMASDEAKLQLGIW